MRITIMKKSKRDNALRDAFRNTTLRMLDAEFHQRGQSENVNGSTRFTMFYAKAQPLEASKV